MVCALPSRGFELIDVFVSAHGGVATLFACCLVGGDPNRWPGQLPVRLDADKASAARATGYHSRGRREFRGEVPLAQAQAEGSSGPCVRPAPPQNSQSVSVANIRAEHLYGLLAAQSGLGEAIARLECDTSLLAVKLAAIAPTLP